MRYPMERLLKMLAPDYVLVLIMMVSLTFYALFGGADYGAGVWDLLAWGPRQQQQRELISDAITPIWEANHVWLVLVIVLLFSGFPSAFAAITTVLEIPLTALIVGIVLRGSSFIFRAYHTSEYRTQKRWGVIFASASTITPVFLGIVVGAISSGKLPLEKDLNTSGYVSPWLGAFPVTVGFFALSLFAFLAAVYLTVESRETELREEFRRKALSSGVFVALMALLTFVTARHGAPQIYHGLLLSSTAWIVHGITAVFAVAAFIGLIRRWYKLARIAAMLQVTSILWGWGFSQNPFLLQNQLTISEAAAEPSVLWSLIIATAIGMVVLFPSLWYLLRLFKAGNEHVPLH